MTPRTPRDPSTIRRSIASKFFRVPTLTPKSASSYWKRLKRDAAVFGACRVLVPESPKKSPRPQSRENTYAERDAPCTKCTSGFARTNKRPDFCWHQPVDRCKSCTKDSFWSACDIFWTFDTELSGEMTRTAYVKGLANALSVQKFRLLRRARLDIRFRKSPQPIKLHPEFIKMVWPNVSESDLDAMLIWARHREAWQLLNDGSFTFPDAKIRKVFDLLDECRIGQVDLMDVVRANLLPFEEVKKIKSDINMEQYVTIDLFRLHVAPALRLYYGVKDADEQFCVLDLGLSFKAKKEAADKRHTVFQAP